MKEKLKFVFNILLLSIFDASIVLNVMEIYEKYPSYSIINNVALLLLTLLVGLVLLKETYIQARDFINDKFRPEEDYNMEEDENYGDIEYIDEDELGHEDFY